MATTALTEHGAWQPGCPEDCHAPGLLARVNWPRSRSAPLVPKNSKERGLSKDSKHGSASALSCLGWLSQDRGGGTMPAFCKPALPFHTALKSTCWDVPSTETSFDKLTSLGERFGLVFSSRFGYLLLQALGIRCNGHMANPEFSPHMVEQL